MSLKEYVDFIERANEIFVNTSMPLYITLYYGQTLLMKLYGNINTIGNA